MASSVEPIIGIDLGTTNSVVAIIENETPHIIINAEGASKTPSTVAFLDDGEVVTGEIARRQAATIPQRTISSAKRLLGRFKQELDQEGEVYPFPLGEDKEGRVTIIIGDRAYAPEQISALVLEKLKAAAEDYLGQPVKKAIITVPAYFDDLQRHATLEAARMAGLEVPRLINEPTAAAMAYGLEKDSTETVAIYDFGGGTFDFSVLEIDQKTFEVLTTTGNSRLGGDDLDMVLLDSVADRFLKHHGIDLRSDHMTFRRLKDEIERAKCELSSGDSVAITLPFIAYKDGQPLHLEERVTREALEELIEPFVEETLNCCRSALKDARIRKNQITKVILVGGSTRIPLVQESVEDFFGMAPFRGVNPDEVVAIGAAIQGAVLNGSLEEVVLLDVTPHTLSIETKGNRKSALIEKNSTIPIRVHKTFTTTEDNQSFVNIHLLQGEEEKASENRSLGKFTLSGIPESRCGEPRIRVEIFVNADGVVEVSASESHSGKEQKLTATFSYLDHAERRARQGLSPSSNRRRRRTAASAGSDTRKRILAGAPVVAAPVAPPPEAPAPAPASAEMASSFAEVDESHPHSTARRRRPLAPPPAPPAPVPVPSAAQPAPVAPDRHPSRDQTEVSARTAAALAARQAASPQPALATMDLGTQEREVAEIPPPPACPIPVTDCPAEFTEMVHLLINDSADASAAMIYERDRKAFLLYCREHEEDPALQALKVRLLIHGKQPEEARDAILEMRKRWPEARVEHHELYGKLCHNYPNYVSARHERAMLAYEIGDLKMAMVDLEFCSKREDADTKIFDELSRVYERILVDHEDSTLQFKLVKTYLRKGELDNAISLLQKLVQIPAFQERANKVLGLCFWQKGLRYLAFQKFKAIPVNDEVKDILYRLATEMEEKDELLHAKYALERIYEADIGYRDSAERLKKLSYRIDLMKDDRYGGAQPPFDVSGAATMRQPRLGDRFDIIEEINRGSMGIVFKAHDQLLDEVVAVKILNDFLCADPDAVARFKREAKSARRLTHANIVRIHDFLDLDDKKVISMEYIEGEDMKRILARNMTLTEDMVIYYVRQICEAMAYAHDLGVVHRDIKPANIMINERNQVKVTDFGIAKVIDSSATRNNGTMIMGTPLYMAPEQIQGGRIDPRADIYALGIMLYELLTGAPPFREGSIEYQHLHSPIPEIKYGASAGLKKIIYRAVEKNPDDRFQSIRELMAELPS